MENITEIPDSYLDYYGWEFLDSEEEEEIVEEEEDDDEEEDEEREPEEIDIFADFPELVAERKTRIELEKEKLRKIIDVIPIEIQ